MIDSLDMTDADRSLLVERCGACSERQVVITHGTDTMVRTAAALSAAMAGHASTEEPSTGNHPAGVSGGAGLHGKTVVLTGAMVPYAFGSSDGLFNLGSALSFAQSLPPGVYVAMNGRWFPADDVRKNRETGYFEPLAAS
jgi:L-asparaginase